MQDKNQAAVMLGKLSAKSRLGKLTKKQRRDAMKKLWLKSIEVRKRALALTTK